MNARSKTLALTLALFASCGGANPKGMTDEGYAALRSGQYKEAVGHFESALSALGTNTSGPDFKRAKMGSIEALVHTDAAKAKEQFLAYAAGSPSQVTDKDFNQIGGLLGSAGKVSDGIEVLKSGMDAYPESVHLQFLVAQLGDMAKRSGSTAELEALKGLGYVGD